MLFWELIFIILILPWAYIPIVLGIWDKDEPKWIRWVINQCIGNFR